MRIGDSNDLLEDFSALNVSVSMCVRYFMYHTSPATSSTNVSFDKLAY